MVNTSLAFTMILFGLVAVILGAEFLGKPKGGRPIQKKLHRIFGYLFLLIFVVLTVVMSTHFTDTVPFSTLSTVHAELAMIALVLLGIKIAVARRYKKFYSLLFPFGVGVFTLSFAFVLLAGGPVLGRVISGKPNLAVQQQAQPESADQGDKTPLKVLPVEAKFYRLCGQCHPLGTTLYGLHEIKTQEQWQKVIDRMREKTTDISEADGKQIAEYLGSLAE